MSIAWARGQHAARFSFRFEVVAQTISEFPLQKHVGLYPKILCTILVQLLRYFEVELSALITEELKTFIFLR